MDGAPGAEERQQGDTAAAAVGVLRKSQSLCCHANTIIIITITIIEVPSAARVSHSPTWMCEQ